MYLPPSFREPRTEVMHDLIEAHPLGVVVTSSAGGLFATHMPWVLDRTVGPLGTLRGHIARSNPHHRLDTGTAGRVVPTWNYVAVHAYGTVRFVDEAEYVLRNVEALTRRHEAGRERPWSIQDAPVEYLAGLAKAVIGLEVPIARLEGKWKLSQNREARDAEGVASGLAASADAREREVARLVAERLAARRDRGAGDHTGPERT